VFRQIVDPLERSGDLHFTANLWSTFRDLWLGVRSFGYFRFSRGRYRHRHQPLCLAERPAMPVKLTPAAGSNSAALDLGNGKSWPPRRPVTMRGRMEASPSRNNTASPLATPPRCRAYGQRRDVVQRGLDRQKRIGEVSLTGGRSMAQKPRPVPGVSYRPRQRVRPASPQRRDTARAPQRPGRNPGPASAHRWPFPHSAANTAWSGSGISSNSSRGSLRTAPAPPFPVRGQVIRRARRRLYGGKSAAALARSCRLNVATGRG